jgi:hypothetical protein
MLLKRRPPGISSDNPDRSAGFEHLEPSAISVLRWLNANKIDFVLVGPVARAIRGETETTGPVAIVPAPYGRNFERLCTALVAEHAGLRSDQGTHGSGTRPAAAPIKLTSEKLAAGNRWLLRFGKYDLDIEASESRYQELLYEAGRFEIASGVSVEAAAPEDLEHYSHVRRTGTSPEFRVTRKAQAEHETA